MTGATRLDVIEFEEGILPGDVQYHRIEFADGTFWETDTIIEKASTPHNFSGTSGSDNIRTYDTNDTLFGNSGFDTLISGAGNDSINGGGGDDLLLGEAGDDKIYGSYGNDTVGWCWQRYVKRKSW